MQADEFEKKIRDKMEQFELVPNTGVWLHVATRINFEKKKRRLLLYWLIFGLVALTGASTFWLVNTKIENKVAVTGKKDGKLQSETFKMKKSDNSRLHKFNKIHEEYQEKHFNEIKKKKPEYLITEKIKSYENKAINNTKDLRGGSAPKLNKAPDIALGKRQSTPHNLPPHIFYSPNAVVRKDDNPDKRMDLGKAPSGINTSAASTTDKNINTNESVSKKWNWGFTIYAGISDNLNRLPLLQDETYARDYLASPGSNVNYGNYSVPTLNNFGSSASFGFGLSLKKQIAKKVVLSVGLDYRRYTAVSVVGAGQSQQTTFYDSLLEKSTSVNGYYAGGNSTKYSNKYDLVELPIALEYQVNRNPNKPLLITAGISPGYMISSNALYANPSIGIYYVDKQKYNRGQLSLHAGFSFPISGSNRYLLSAGPLLEYGITNAAKSYYNSSQHLVFAGLKANTTFK